MLKKIYKKTTNEINLKSSERHTRIKGITLDINEIIFGIIILAYIIYSILGIDLPWGYEHNGFIGAEKSTFAMNYRKFGYIESKLGQITNVGSIEAGNEKYEYYVHHPIGMAFLVSLSFLIFGVHDWSARLIPIMINIGSITFLYLFVKEYWNKRTAVVSCFVMVFTPMFFYTRNFVAMELLVVFFVVMLLYFYVIWLKTEKKKYFYLIFIIFSLGTFSDWQFYFIVPAIITHYFGFVKKKQKNKKLFYLILLSFLMFFVYLGHVWLLTGSVSGGENGVAGNLRDNLLFRLNLDAASKTYNITAIGLFEKLYRDFLQFYTKILLFTTIIFGILFLNKIYKKKSYEKEALPLLVFLSFFSTYIIFSNLFWIHGFLLLFLNPMIAIFSALVIENSWGFIRGRNPTYRTFFSILLIGIFIIYMNNFYDSSNQIYQDNNRIDPIIEFLSKNNENLIISFDLHPQAYKFKFYLSKVLVKDIRNRRELIDILNNENNYRYFLVRDKKNLIDFLSKYYFYEKVGDYFVFDLNIPLSQMPLNGEDKFSDASPSDVKPPRIVVFEPEEDTTLSNEIAINSVSDESCSFVYSWDGKGNITGPVGGYNLKVMKGEFTNDEDRNIVLELHMNEKRGTKIFDDSGKTNHGTLNNGDWVSGKFGSATGYDGISSYIIIDDAPSLRISGSELTISSWVWIEDDSSWRPIVRKGTNGFLNYLLLITPDNKLGIRMDNVVDIHMESNHPIPVNRWVHVAGVYDGTNLNLFINGELDARKNAEGDLISSNTQDLTVGREIDQNVWFSGYIDELIIWNRSLSTSEIKKVYNSTLAIGDHYVDVYCKDSNSNWGHARKDYILK